MKKNIILLIFSCLLMPNAWAVSSFVIGNLEYTPLNKDTTIDGNKYPTVEVGQAYPSKNKPTGALTIPATVEYEHVTYRVTAIENHTDEKATPGGFYGCPQITSISFPEGLQRIGYKAFAQDPNIEGTITIPASVNYFGERAFYGCAAITHIELQSKNIPNLQGTVVSIFNLSPGNDLYPIFIIPDGEIDNYLAEWNRSQLVYYEKSSNVFSIEKLKYKVTDTHSKEVNISSGILTGSITIPDTVPYYNETYKVTAIKDEGFSNTKDIDTVTLGSNIKEIGIKAFYKCSDLKCVTLNENITTIKEKAFATTVNLTCPLTFPSTLESLGFHAFYGCNVESYTFEGDAPEFIPEIGKSTTEKASILFGTTINNAPDKKFYIECGNRTFDDWNITCEEKCPSTIINAGDEYDGKDTDTRFKKITYKRIFTPGVWETLYLPFKLDSMTITHKEVNEGKPLNINFPWNKEDGGYFHLAVRNGEYFEYIQQKDAKLQGHKAYIIQFPSEAFKDVIVTFTSDGYTDINTTFYQQDATTNHNMYGNTTLKNQELSDAAYYLGNDNNFKYTESYTLKPFECYLTPIVETQSYVNPRMMSVRFRPQSDVTTDVPNINTDQISWQRNGNTLTIQTNGQPVNIYNINGMLIHSFAEGNEQVSIDLDNGCYIINSLGYTQKIIF